MDQFWQTLRPVRRVGKTRGVITVPVFTAPCGPSNYSFGVNNTGQAQGTAPAAFDLTTALTIEAWAKIPLLYHTSGTLTIVCNMSKYRVSILNGGYVRFGLTKAAVVNNLTSAGVISADRMTHVACVYDGTTMKIYINGILDANTLALASPIDAAGSFVFSGPSSLTNATVSINELRVWNIARTANQIQTAMHMPRSITETGLIGYWPFNEGTGTTSANRIAASTFNLTFSGDYFWNLTDSYPYLLGASFIPGQFLIDTGGKSYSIKYPVKKPYASVNFVPCIRWTTSAGVVKRFKLWNAIAGFDVNPPIPDYHGEKIPDGAYLEIWNSDGESTVDLTTAMNIETSILHVTTNPTTTTRSSDADISAGPDTTLAENFPGSFPLTFASQQDYDV